MAPRRSVLATVALVLLLATASTASARKLLNDGPALFCCTLEEHLKGFLCCGTADGMEFCSPSCDTVPAKSMVSPPSTVPRHLAETACTWAGHCAGAVCQASWAHSFCLLNLPASAFCWDKMRPVACPSHQAVQCMQLLSSLADFHPLLDYADRQRLLWRPLLQFWRLHSASHPRLRLHLGWPLRRRGLPGQ